MFALLIVVEVGMQGIYLISVDLVTLMQLMIVFKIVIVYMEVQLN